MKFFRITFNTSGYDPFIDFIKAYAIVCVLIGHTIPGISYAGYGLWAGMQVPLFILIQGFHGLKRKPQLNIIKLFIRVIIPFFIVQTIAVVFLYDGNLGNLLYYGGYGPGSYFPWIYIQFFLLMPLIYKLFNKKQLNLIIILLICEGGEILCSLVHFPDTIYRLFGIRYLFLFYFAWKWVQQGIIINKKTLFFSLISAISIIYFEYISDNDEPVFFHTVWSFHRWPCYYYVANLLVWLLYICFKKLEKYPKCMMIIHKLAKCSYEIFLIQMVLIAGISDKNILTQTMFNNIIKIILIFFVSIIGGIIFNKYYQVFTQKVLIKKS